MNENFTKPKEETSLSDVLTQFILTSIILGILINFVWWYYKFTEFLHKNLTSDDTFIDWLIKDNYQIFIDGGFIVSLLISILSSFFVLVLIWIFFRSSDNNPVINKEKILHSEDINLEDNDESIKKESNIETTTIEEVEEVEAEIEQVEEEEESPLDEETPAEEIEEEEAPVEEVKEEVIIQNEYEEGLSIEEIERDFEKYNLLFIKKIYGKRVHRRKIIELERKVDKLKSLGEISEDYELC